MSVYIAQIHSRIGQVCLHQRIKLGNGLLDRPMGNAVRSFFPIQIIADMLVRKGRPSSFVYSLLGKALPTSTWPNKVHFSVGAGVTLDNLKNSCLARGCRI